VEAIAAFSLSPILRGEGGGEGQGARDVGKPSDETTPARRQIERFIDVVHRSPLSPTLSPEYREEGAKKITP